ncbi:hypothetical protein [Halalkalibacter urbisdiaboli]|uniref:hypothetical protein n=1 Tax=Halalkalibacter urbisdiaboli TaxID=1960589 RepID=UPI000B449262|nr:hypothetical protein [Halalkalibacter urbisdiaboli]
MTFLYAHSWLFFFLSEGLTWVATFSFFIIRYRFKFNKLSTWCLAFIIFCTLFQTLLVSINYYFTGSVSFFQAVILLFIVYAITLGSGDFQRLDNYIKRKFFIDDRYKYRIRRNRSDDERLFFHKRRQLFIIHLVAFSLFHTLWFIVNSSLFQPKPEMIIKTLTYPHLGFFESPLLNIVSYIWRILFFFDLCINIIYKILRR